MRISIVWGYLYKMKQIYISNEFLQDAVVNKSGAIYTIKEDSFEEFVKILELNRIKFRI